MHPVESAHDLLDRFLAAASDKSAALGRPVTCRAGCFHCCKEPLLVEIAEAQHIAAQFQGEARERLKDRVAIWWAQFFAGRHDSDAAPRDQDGSQLWRYLGENIWCPVLQDGLCGAYSARPAGCRVFLAVGSPSRCATLEKRKGQKFLQTKEDAHVMQGFMAELCQGAQQALFQYDHMGIWLGHILLGKTQRSRSAENLLVTVKDPQIKMP